MKKLPTIDLRALANVTGGFVDCALPQPGESAWSIKGLVRRIQCARAMSWGAQF